MGTSSLWNILAARAELPGSCWNGDFICGVGGNQKIKIASGYIEW
jgi:hypothetical protein